MLALQSGAPFDRELFGFSLVLAVAIETVYGYGGMNERLHGSDPAQLGFLALTAMLLFSSKQGPFTWIIRSSMIIVVALTQTRSVYFALAVVLILWFLPSVKMWYVLLTLAASGLLGLRAVDWVTSTLALNEDSGVLRYTNLVGAVQVLKDHPLLGVGWGGAQDGGALMSAGIAQTTGVYNLVLGVLTAGGILAGASFLVFLYLKTSPMLEVDRPAALVVVAFFALGLTEFPLWPGGYSMPLLFIAIGMGSLKSDVSLAPPNQAGDSPAVKPQSVQPR
jgi:hypothetical protein